MNVKATVYGTASYDSVQLMAIMIKAVPRNSETSTNVLLLAAPCTSIKTNSFIINYYLSLRAIQYINNTNFYAVKLINSLLSDLI